MDAYALSRKDGDANADPNADTDRNAYPDCGLYGHRGPDQDGQYDRDTHQDAKRHYYAYWKPWLCGSERLQDLSG